MNNSSKRKIDNYRTDRLAPHQQPFHIGLYGAQAIGPDPTGAHVTIYRKKFESITQWIKTFARHNRIAGFLTKPKSGLWTEYDATGETPDRLVSGPMTQATLCSEVISVDREALLQEARDLIGDPDITLVACSERHAGASAADMVNFNVECRHIIGGARYTDDLEHSYVVDSRMWPCPVTGVFANISKQSTALQDMFLDRFEWNENSWPMGQGFDEMLADQLSTHRQDYVCDLLWQCGRSANMSEGHITDIAAKWMSASPGSKYRFAQHIVETLKRGLVFEKHTAETFSPEIVNSNGAAVVKGYNELLNC